MKNNFKVKRSWYLSLILLAFVGLSNCSGNPTNTESTHGSESEVHTFDADHKAGEEQIRATESHADSTFENSSGELKEKDIDSAIDSLKEAPSSHAAPGQAEIDSLKKAKTSGKFK